MIAGTSPARIRLNTLTEAIPEVASVKMIMLCEVGMMAPTSEAWVVTLTA
jgi:hypothetical protein